MNRRPAIPASIRRAIFVEAGHRCAVCGAPCPLEQAHIIPWRKNPVHRQEDLICLCANCHARADNENWGEEALREYKARPWITRGDNQSKMRIVEPPGRVTMQIDMEIEQFDSYKENILRHALAGLLHIYPGQIKVISKKRGSTKVTLILPKSSAEKLIQYQKTNAPELGRYLSIFNIESIYAEEEMQVEGSEEEVVLNSLAVGLSDGRIKPFPASLYKRPLTRPHEIRRQLRDLTETDLRRLERMSKILTQRYRESNASWDYEDLLTETFVKVLEGEREWRKGVPFVAYVSDTMKGVARRHFISDMQKKAPETSYEKATEAIDEKIHTMISALPDPEQLARLREEVRNLRRLFTNDEITIHVLDGWMLGMTPAEICEYLGISTNQYNAARRRILRVTRQRS